MKTQKEKISLMKLRTLKEKINVESDYQRLPVWKREQEQRLIDSILRGYDIPKIYVKREEEGTQYDYEVIDGKQRLTAIWKFFNGDFGLPENAEPINEIECKSESYDDLDKRLRDHFDEYKVDFAIVTDARDDEEVDEIGELFSRLQKGSPLNAQEKRNAMPGNMRDFVKKLAEHDFFKSCAINNKRYGHDQIAAKLVLLEYYFNETASPTNVASDDLDRFYKEQTDFNMHEVVAENVEKVLDYLQRVFPDKIPELVQHSVTTLYCLASKLVRGNIADGTEDLLHKWFMEFEEKRRENDAQEEDDQKDPTLQEYKFCISSGSESQKRIKKRLEILEDSFYEANPNIKRI